MRWRIPLVAVLALFVVAGCDQQPAAPTTDQAVAEAPAFNWMNNPDNGNPNIVRYEGGWIWWWDYPPAITPDGEWWTIAEGIEDFNDMIACEGPGSDTPQSWQEVNIGDRIIGQMQRKKAPAYAFHSEDFYANRWCDLSGYEIAEGTASTRLNDNDATVVTDNNVWSVKFNAWLTDLDTGEKYKAHWNVTLRIHNGDFAVLTEHCSLIGNAFGDACFGG